MAQRTLFTFICSLAALTQATTPPSYDGYSLVWDDDFSGSAGASPNTNNWNIITGNLGVNDEAETYTSSSSNLQLSGGSTLQIIPLKSDAGAWTSGRIESTYVFTPVDGAISRVEATLRFGDNAAANKQGIWPAWWMLGDALRTGGEWPECGELDIMEQVDGDLVGHGTAHCDVYPGGICNEGTGLGASIQIPDNSWHTWRIELNRQDSNYLNQAITWYMDGTQFQQITGTSIGDEAVWATLCQSPLYFILNVAVGGDWPGQPNDSTLGGTGSMMEVEYVAYYTS